MAGVPQITNPIQGKSYSSTLNSRQSDNEQFDIIQLTRAAETGVEETAAHDTANRQLTRDRKDLLPMAVKTPKDPTMAVETLKQLINSDLLATAKANGYTELYGELEALSNSIYLTEDQLVRELMIQERQTTMFSGHELFDILRELGGKAIASGNEEFAQSIGSFLKAVNFSLNRDEILSALSANLRFLSDYFAPSGTLSEKLFSLSEMWSGDDARGFFELLKGDTLSLLGNVSESLLNNEKTQILIPLITHNLSRYNTNNYMLRDYFSALLLYVPQSIRNKLVAAFEDYAEKLSSGEQNELFKSDIDNDTTISEKNQEVFENNNAFPKLLEEKIAEGSFSLSRENTEESLEQALKAFLSGNTDQLTAVRQTLFGLAESDELLSALYEDLERIDSISVLVDYLNDILKLLPDAPERQSLFETLSETVSVMAERDELPPESPEKPNEKAIPVDPNKSALDDLTKFIEKNINHAALKTLNSFNASNLLQSLINAPGVFTPLSHYVIPLQIGETKAFGELWVDNDEKNAAAKQSGEKKNYHLFLTFDVETMGRFEADLYASGQEINLSFLYPNGFADEAYGLKEKIVRIAADTGYFIKDFRTAPLKEPHNLTQVFPRILERRTGLDVRV